MVEFHETEKVMEDKLSKAGRYFVTSLYLKVLLCSPAPLFEESAVNGLKMYKYHLGVHSILGVVKQTEGD